MRDLPLTALAAGIAVLIITGIISTDMVVMGTVFIGIFLAIRWVLELIFGTYE